MKIKKMFKQLKDYFNGRIIEIKITEIKITKNDND